MVLDRLEARAGDGESVRTAVDGEDRILREGRGLRAGHPGRVSDHQRELLLDAQDVLEVTAAYVDARLEAGRSGVPLGVRDRGRVEIDTHQAPVGVSDGGQPDLSRAAAQLQYRSRGELG